ncbi:MAG TPA: LysR family transcriptional regulator [Microbacterium sp.]|uniref:LysR family transcriptional regulator n=1 Tax=Microbacterium sp. TaxID=51671 RepID=UPI002CFCD4D2|nr:LysR family transcriptional regulator [Microbacterium sp.]HWI30074.1 LysR family transcriptional regulator [Microbacterium sp.]
MESLGAGMMPSAPSPSFTIRQLECFVAVARCGSISKAADVVRASDSAVSDALTAMERALGATLFHRRRSKGATLTSDGLAILPLAHRMLDDAEELSAAVGRAAGTLIGPVRVGAVDTLAPVVLPRLIALMRERHPAVRVVFRTGDQPTLADALASAELDLLITFDIDVPPELRRRPMFSTQASLVVSSDHPLAARESVSLEEVADEPMVLLDIYASRVHTMELMSSRSITPRIAYRTDSYELCRSLVGRGLGYTLLMRRFIDAQTWDGRTVSFVPISPAPRRVDILAAWVDGTHPPRLAALIEAAAAVGQDIDMG